MSSVFLTEAPKDSAERLGELENGELLLFFRSLPWKTFLKTYVASLSPGEGKGLLKSLVQACKTELGVIVTMDLVDADESTIESELLSVYLSRAASGRNVEEVVQDIMRTSSALEDLDEPRHALASCLDAVMMQDATQKSLLPIAKALNDSGLECAEVSSKTGKSSKFYTPKIRPRDAFKRLMAFWAANVSAVSVEGFIGRAFSEPRSERLAMFQKSWDKSLILDLDAPDACRLCSFLNADGEVTSPSAAACKKQLRGFLSEAKSSGKKKQPKKTANAGGGVGSGGAGASATQVGDDFTRGPDTSEAVEVTLPPGAGVRGALEALVLDGNDPDNSSSSSSSSSSSASSQNSSSSSGRSDDKKRHRGRRSRRGKKGKGKGKGSRREVPDFCHHPLYKDLPRSMHKVLRQGGPSLWEMFEPRALEVTTASELVKLQRYHNKVRMIVAQLCRAKGLMETHEACAAKLETGVVRRIRPEERINQGVTFTPTSCIAPMELSRWLQHGELKTWLESTVARAGPLHLDTQEGHLARDILSTGLVLASLMDEFHPSNLIQSVAVERLVRRLVIYEKALSVDKKTRGQFLIKNLAFMGLGGGATPETEAALVI